MISSLQSSPAVLAMPWQSSTDRTARSLAFQIEGTQGSWQPEPSEEEEAAAKAQPISIPRSMTPEEKARVEYLQDQLTGLLQELAQNPTEDQQDRRARIREIEKELEALTGVKVKSSLSSMAAKLPKEVQDKEEEQHHNPVGMPSEMLAETIGTKMLPVADYGDGSGVMAQMLRSATSIPGLDQTSMNLASRTLATTGAKNTF